MPSQTAQALLTRPQSVPLRKAVFQIHVWTGIAVCLWVVLVCTTGAALVFRLSMQKAIYPELFAASPGTPADAATVLERVRDAFPDHRIYGIDGPTHERPTTIAYLGQPDQRSRVVLIDPATSRILGQLPQRSILDTLGGLHANLLAGRLGRIVNLTGSLMLLGLCATGIVIWWPGIAAWRRAFIVDFRRNWRRVTWELHGAVGIWTLAFVVMWAATGVYFGASGPIRRALNAISPLTTASVPTSTPEAANGSPRSWRELIAHAQDRLPDQHIYRLIPPGSETEPFVVMFSRSSPLPAGPEKLTTIYLDQYTGDLLGEPRPAVRSLGDLIIEWIVPLHFGTFGGTGVRLIWTILGLAPAVLAVTGFVMWWSRVVRPRARLAADRAGTG